MREMRGERGAEASEMSEVESSAETPARLELRRAYLHLSFGDVDAALEACARARELAPDEVAPALVEGSTLMAAGRLREALGSLRKTTRRWPSEALGHLYFAEVSWLNGRARQARKSLERAEALDASGIHAEYMEGLRVLWDAWGEGAPPAPLVVGDGA